MGKFVVNDQQNNLRHPISKNPQLGPPLFVDAKDKDLPYDGQCKHATSSIFDHPLGLKQEGALLMAILTSAQWSDVEKVTKGISEKQSLYANIGDQGVLHPLLSCGGVKEKKKKKLNKADAIKELFFGSALGTTKKRRSRLSLQQSSPLQKAYIGVEDVAIDTRDLEQLTGDDNNQENDSWLLESATDKEKLYKKKLDLEASIGDEKTIPIDEYLKLLKKSTGRIGYCTQLLDELALGEDIDMWVKESDLPSLPPPPPPEKSEETKERDPEKAKETTSGYPAKPSPEYKGAMRATSLVVKKARRLAGLMHIEQQSNDLKDICVWLQHLGHVSIRHTAKFDDNTRTRLQGATPGAVAINPLEGQKGDWRLPTSPAAALLMAQDDLLQRLAHLYEEKSLMETRKDQLDAAKKLVTKSINGDGEEEGYEVLGGKIAENLDDVDKLDKHYKKLNKKANEEEEIKSHKGKKGSKVKKVAVHRNVEKDQSGSESDLDEDTPSEGHRRQSRKRRKNIGKYEYRGDDLFYGTSEGNEIEEGNKSSKRGKTTKSTKKAPSQVDGDSEVEEAKVVRTTMLKEDGTDIKGGKKDRKRAKLKIADSKQEQEKDNARVETSNLHQNAQIPTKYLKPVGSGEISGTNSKISTESAESKEQQSTLEQKVQPLPNVMLVPKPQMQSPMHGQLSTRDGQNDNNNETALTHGGPSGGPLGKTDGNDIVDGDIEPQDLPRINRQDTKAQVRGMQTLTQPKDFDHDIQDDFENANNIVSHSKVLLQDQAIQTDDAVLFSLMESMMESMPNDYQPSGMEDEASELKRLRRDIKKARMQLRFWRSRNWVEKHSHLSPHGHNLHPILDSPSEVGFSFYFNVIRAPSLITHPVNYPMTHSIGSSWRDHTTTPVKIRESQDKILHPPQPMNAKLLSNAPLLAHARLPRTSRRSSSELQSLAAGTGLVIFGRSSTLMTPHTEAPGIAHLPTHENRVSRLSPRLSGVQYQKA